MTVTAETLVEDVAAGMADAELWPGAWAKMPEAERGVWRHRARAALAAVAKAAGGAEALAQMAEDILLYLEPDDDEQAATDMRIVKTLRALAEVADA